MTHTPKEETEILLTAVFPFAQEQLRKYGEFFPFAAVMIEGDEVQMLAPHTGEEHPKSQKVIDAIEHAFILGAKKMSSRQLRLCTLAQPEILKREKPKTRSVST